MPMRIGKMVTGGFLKEYAAREQVIALSPPERFLKAKMLACFRTQREMLNNFRLDTESFRDAPPYDFSQPPHPGQLLSEK